MTGSAVGDISESPEGTPIVIVHLQGESILYHFDHLRRDCSILHTLKHASLIARDAERRALYQVFLDVRKGAGQTAAALIKDTEVMILRV